MKLSVTYAKRVSGSGDLVSYDATPADSAKITEEKLDELAKRIRDMGVKLIGENFYSTNTDYEKRTISIYVYQGLSSGEKRLDFRSFLGWVEIFDEE